MGNLEWFNLFPEAALLALPIHQSDHSPLILDTCWVIKGQRRLKRFEESWLNCQEVLEIAHKVWEMNVEGSLVFRILQK